MAKSEFITKQTTMRAIVWACMPWTSCSFCRTWLYVILPSRAICVKLLVVPCDVVARAWKATVGACFTQSMLLYADYVRIAPGIMVGLNLMDNPNKNFKVLSWNVVSSVLTSYVYKKSS
jgi:hypothetical protein